MSAALAGSERKWGAGFQIILTIAVRNLFANFLNWVIGAIVLVGTLLFVVGSSLINSMDASMSKSITGSYAGHLQVYNGASKDKLSLFGNWTPPDLEPVVDFSKVRGPLEAIPNVKSVIPMGVSSVSVTYGNTLDQELEKLRGLIRSKTIRSKSMTGNLASKADPKEESEKQIQSLISHIRKIISVILSDYEKLTIIASKQAIDVENKTLLEKASSEAFWGSFSKDPLGHLEFLENKIASLLPDADFIFLSYLGTDLAKYKAGFDRMKIVDGQEIPKGERGILISKFIYEHAFKLKCASQMDDIYEALKFQGKTIATDPDLKLLVKQNKTQIRDVVLQLDPLLEAKVIGILQKFLHSQEKSVATLLAQFFDTNDQNFFERYKLLYDEITPLLQLYRLKPGDTITLKSFTKNGFIKSLNLKIYGTFQFSGLEKSGLSGAISLTDLMSFRDLYGFVTPEKVEETESLKKQVSAKVVDRASAEAELFGGSSLVTEAKAEKIDEKKELGEPRLVSQKNRAYTQEEIDSGSVLSAAILLKDPSQLQATQKEIERVSEESHLGLKVLNWQQASGNLGQFVLVAKLGLYFAVGIIFIVALVIINNAVMMATLQRIAEVGTMRAIGAQKSFVLALVLVETLLLGLVFGGIGTLLGSGIVHWLSQVGIPAKNDFLYFFFAGPRLYAQLDKSSLFGAGIIISIVTCMSSLYPALIASKVSPLRAMQTEE